MSLRWHLSMPGLLSGVREAFEAIPDTVNNRGFTLTNCLMSALAMFHLKCPSLLQFDTMTRGAKADPTIVHNLQTPFGVSRVLSDTGMRERLDRVDHKALRKSFRVVHAALQRGKALEHFTVQFNSSSVNCPSCCQRTRRSGTEDSHQLIGAALVHPAVRIVFPPPRR